jgi:hypothetical protein
MIADFFMKTLQGAPFRKLPDHIMNLAPSSAYPISFQQLGPQECVETQIARAQFR